MTNISFDREAVGIVEKAQWTDAEDLGQVAAAVGNLRHNEVAILLPLDDCPGVSALRQAMSNFSSLMGIAVSEFSDACAELGSGVAEYTADADATETYNAEKARIAAQRLGVGEVL